MESCIFCKIARGEIPSEMVMTSDHAFAFLDINPLARGHVLVIPKVHAERVEDMAPEVLADLMLLSQRVLRRQTSAIGAQGMTVAFNNGRAAGQEVPHAHLHLVPRMEGDGRGPIHALFANPPKLQPDELKEIGAKMRR